MHRIPYSQQIKKILTSPEISLFKKLSTPKRIQDYLDTLSINFELSGETNMSPRRTLRDKRAHCVEGALLAAAILAFHGRKPLLMDFQTTPDDEDHVIALFTENGLWGAISKTNHATIRYRDPLYQSPRELAMSYAHEYLKWDGTKSLLAVSNPFDLSRYDPARWVTPKEDLDWLVDDLDKWKHFPLASRKILRALRKASDIELRAMKLVEWRDPRKRRALRARG